MKSFKELNLQEKALDADGTKKLWFANASKFDTKGREWTKGIDAKELKKLQKHLDAVSEWMYDNVIDL
jgi:hypothetical protein